MTEIKVTPDKTKTDRPEAKRRVMVVEPGGKIRERNEYVISPQESQKVLPKKRFLEICLELAIWDISRSLSWIPYFRRKVDKIEGNLRFQDYEKFCQLARGGK